MPADIGSQIVTILYYRLANSSIVNRRFQGIRKLGIYSGGYLSVVDDENAQIATLVCEISDGTYQVRVETTSTVNLAVASATPYIVLRWIYTGAISDYMELLAVATPAANGNDIVVGKCTFDGSDDLNGFDYQDSSYPRTTPNTQDLFLRIEATPDTELRVRIRAGRIQTNNGVVDISDQKSPLLVPPDSNSRIDLIYVTDAGVIALDSSGTPAANPSPPSYDGKLVLAEVTISNGDINITADKIKDVRSFLASSLVHAYASIYANSEQSIPGGNVYTKIVYDSTIVDSTGNIVDLANNRLKPDVAGWYVVTVVAGLENMVDNDQMAVGIKKNGVISVSFGHYPSNAVSGQSDPVGTVSALVYLNGSTDYVEAYILHQTVGNKNTLEGLSRPFFLFKVG